MLILGISDSHDASVALVDDDNILAAVSEERFTRRKRHSGFPYRSIGYIQGFLSGRGIDKVYVSGKYGRSLFRLLNGLYSRSSPQKDICSFSSRLACWWENSVALLPILRNLEAGLSLLILKIRLRRAGINCRKIELIEHHYCHLVSVLSGMASDHYIAVSLDAYGDAKSGLIIHVENKKLISAKGISYQDSIASFYGFLCAYLGFKEGEEGKVMALADYGKETILLNIFRGILRVSCAGLKISGGYKKRKFLKALGRYSREDVSYALQKTVEEAVIRLITKALPARRKPDLLLAGGFFANVKVNQRLHDTGLFNRIFIFPHMGDGGTAFVSALRDKGLEPAARYVNNIVRLNVAGIKDVYLGCAYTDKYIRNILDAQRLSYTEESDIENKTASLLAAGKAVARFHGRMEYGPRALGNRSILYRTDDPTVNHWLNKNLQRAPYMPFAPVTLFEFKDSCYINVDGAADASQFMTMSFACTDWMKRVSPGAVHIDGTARPQLLKKEHNPGYYKILQTYCSLTGIPSLINTSFNLHNEPIVCSPEDALRTFKIAKLDYLAIGRFLVKGLGAKIILVNPVTRNETRVLRVERCQQKALFTVGIWSPVTLMEIAACLQYRGFSNVEIIDGQAERFSFEGLAQEVIRRNPEIIVISATTPTIGDDLLFSGLLKNGLKASRTVFIGLHATVFAEELLKEDSVDYVVRGEPEEVIGDLAEYHFRENGSLIGIRGLGFKDNGRIIINARRPVKDNYDYPLLPDRALLKNERYVLPFTRKPFTVIKVSRGCDFACSFCTSAIYYGKGWRSRSPENILAEVKDAYHKHGIDTFLFLSDTFNGRQDFVSRLSSLIIKEGLKIRWVANSRIDLVDVQTIALMKRSGCLLVSLGIESYDEAILSKNKKYLRLQDIDRGLELLKQQGIKTYGYFIFGLEGESKTSMFQTMLKAAKSKLDFACFYSLTPYPGTGYFSQYNCTRWEEYFHGISNIVQYDGLSSTAIRFYRYLAFGLFYLQPKRLVALFRYFLLRRPVC